jgi:hypothetical protein
MKKQFLTGLPVLVLLSAQVMGQHVKSTEVPEAAKSALMKKYPQASGVSWEKEKGNFEANWGGKSKEDNSVVFTPDGKFVEQVEAIPVSSLPAAVATYVKSHYPGASIKEAGKVTDAAGKISYEAEVKGKDLIFDEKGNFVKID